jgi:hypothetical protein
MNDIPRSLDGFANNGGDCSNLLCSLPSRTSFCGLGNHGNVTSRSEQPNISRECLRTVACVSGGHPRTRLCGIGVGRRLCRVINLADVVSQWRNGSVVQRPEDLDRSDSFGVHAVTARKHSNSIMLRHECRKSTHAIRRGALVGGYRSAEDEKPVEQYPMCNLFLPANIAL